MLSFFKRILSAIGSFFGSFFGAEVNVVTNAQRILTAIDDSKTAIEDGTKRIRQFKFDPHWKTRVINVPAAQKRLRKIYVQLFTDWKARMELLRVPIHSFVLIFKAESEVGTDPLGAPSALARAGAKMDEIATLIAQLADAAEEIAKFAELFDQIINDLETLDDIFLQQSNPRKWVKQRKYLRLP